MSPPPLESQAASLARFVSALSAHRLLDPGQLREVQSFLGSCRGPSDLGRALLERDWLTPFQINEVSRGRASNLFVGPYLLLERLGKGGMGEVFKVRHRTMRRLAALKILLASPLAKAGGAGRFLREIEAVARLDHPNTVHAYDAGEEGNTFYLAMEYVDGVDLRRLVADRGPLPVAQACDFVRQAARGLQHAFERGVVHRDIKPTNLLVTRDGVVKVVDFGLARLWEMQDQPTTPLTLAGRLLGTLDYVAPEQADDAHAADTRADLYSLGCTLYFLLSGRPPFWGGTPVEKVLRHLHEEPLPLDAVRPDVPPALAAVARRLLAKRPEDRYQTAAELVEALEGLMPTRRRDTTT